MALKLGKFKKKNARFFQDLKCNFIFRSSLKETWFYSVSTNWTKGPDMIEARDSHGCASFWFKGNQILAVSPSPTTGKTVEFLDLAQENPQWISGTFYHLYNQPD